MYLNFTSIMRSQCRPIIVRQNWANRECPKVSFQSVCGLGEAVLQGTRSTLLQPLSSATLGEEQKEAGALPGCRHNQDTKLVQSVAGTVWHSQSFRTSLKALCAGAALCSKKLERWVTISWHEGSGLWHLWSESVDQLYMYWIPAKPSCLL